MSEKPEGDANVTRHSSSQQQESETWREAQEKEAARTRQIMLNEARKTRLGMIQELNNHRVNDIRENHIHRVGKWQQYLIDQAHEKGHRHQMHLEETVNRCHDNEQKKADELQALQTKMDKDWNERQKELAEVNDRKLKQLQSLTKQKLDQTRARKALADAEKVRLTSESLNDRGAKCAEVLEEKHQTHLAKMGGNANHRWEFDQRYSEQMVQYQADMMAFDQKLDEDIARATRESQEARQQMANNLAEKTAAKLNQAYKVRTQKQQDRLDYIHNFDQERQKKQENARLIKEEQLAEANRQLKKKTAILTGLKMKSFARAREAYTNKLNKINNRIESDGTKMKRLDQEQKMLRKKQFSNQFHLQSKKQQLSQTLNFVTNAGAAPRGLETMSAEEFLTWCENVKPTPVVRHERSATVSYASGSQTSRPALPTVQNTQNTQIQNINENDPPLSTNVTSAKPTSSSSGGSVYNEDGRGGGGKARRGREEEKPRRKMLFSYKFRSRFVTNMMNDKSDPESKPVYATKASRRK